MTPTRPHDNDTSAVLPVGRWPAPALVEHDAHGRPLPRPYPKRRHTVVWVLRGVGVLAAAAVVVATDAAAVTAAFLFALAVLVADPLARRLVPVPHPTFLTAGYAHPHTLTAHQWIRLPDGWAVQTYDVRVITPGTLGDPTPPVVHVRCSDDITRQFRPQDLVHVVAPVDLT